MHNLTHSPAAACVLSGTLSYANLRQSAFPRTAVKALDNSCHFTLMPSSINSFIPVRNSCSFFFSFSELILPLFICFSYLRPLLCIMPLNLPCLPISFPTIAIQLWQPACGPLGVEIRSYKLNWTQEQLRRWPRKMGQCPTLDAEAPQ